MENNDTIPDLEDAGKFSSVKLPASVSALSASSRGTPSGKEFHIYNNFEERKNPVSHLSPNSTSLLERTCESSEPELRFPSGELDLENGCDWPVNSTDQIFERIDASMEEFERNRDEDAGVRAKMEEGGFQIVCGKKKKKRMAIAADGAIDSGASGCGFKSPTHKNDTGGGAKAKIPYHISSIRRPQEEFNILVNNSSEPFPHVWLDRSDDGTRFIHPLEKLSVSDFVDWNVTTEHQLPLPLEDTPFKFVEDVKDLKLLAIKLREVNEFSVDLEHNHYRSFQGLTCLMQISTRNEDYLIDTLKLKIHLGPHLRDVFKDPLKRKVMHGADKDILWLQRDFGIYICNLFDTGLASKKLKLERNSLEFLLQHFCGITANKEYQTADWRLRPLPIDMIKYAREDTHYLLHIYEKISQILLTMPKEKENDDPPLLEVYKRSNDLCMQLYEKEIFTDNSYLHVYGLQGAGFNAKQLSVASALFGWRDSVARAEDESTGYILPNKILIEIAKRMPLTTGKLREILTGKLPYVERNLGSIVRIVRQSLQNSSAFEAIARSLNEEGVTSADLSESEDAVQELTTSLRRPGLPVTGDFR